MLAVAGAEGMWESLRMIFVSRCTFRAISKVCGKGGKQALSFSGLSINRHFLGPLSQPPVLRGQPQPLKEFGFCLLHAARGIGVTDGCRDALQCVDAQPLAQVLCWFLQQRQGLQRSQIALVTDAFAALLIYFNIGLGARAMVVQIWIQVLAINVIDAVGMACIDVAVADVFADDRSVFGFHQAVVAALARPALGLL